MIKAIYKKRIKQVGNVKSIIKGSTPVLFFGNIETAKVATISLNPSHQEFLKNGELLIGKEQRLESLHSLKANSLQDLDDEQLHRVYAACLNYFDIDQGGRPYKQWFSPFNMVIKEALGFDYYEGTCCHLDIVQWATEKVWSDLDSAEKEMLLATDLPFLKELLHANNFNFLLLNGKTTYANVTKLIGGDLLKETTLYDGQKDSDHPNGLKVWCSIIKVNDEDVKFVGWNRYLQQGVRPYERLKLVETIKQEYAKAIK